MDPTTLLLIVLNVTEGLVGILQLIQLLGTRVALARIEPVIGALTMPWIGEDNETKAAARKGFFKSMAHGFMQAVKERAGSQAGVGARADNGANLEAALQGSAPALSMIKGKVELPIVGKVTIGEAIQIFGAVRQLIGGGNLKELIAQGGSQLQLPQSTSTGQGYPP